ncbi:Crp/Fnr family transcriptional regulator [Streptomyces sp. NBC_01275]|uniref:Crp/Fnr family transcriptional regulator n=1 Tax=Streptomyces sp. NBC_01275 TaxID=2903807 RepID=UPI0022526E43|nr:Crp/Fnr family transcriptional regulator [Streptomyces sp. NBC_01275]MCX4762011.1 Crp/Fnr family transcriptional regulator [Streptomyces sp. NBC_01275]
MTAVWAAGSLLDTIDTVDRDALLRLGTRRRYADQEVLMAAGAVGDAVYMLLDGLVLVVGATEDGEEPVLAIRAAGEVVGELAVLDGNLRSATVRAAGPVTALRIAPASFIAFLHSHPAAQLQVLRSVARKLRSATQRRIETSGCDARRRLARVLYELAAEYGRPRRDGAVLLELSLSQRALGSLAGVSVSTTERMLAELRAENVLTTGYRQLLLLSPDRLTTLCGY